MMKFIKKRVLAVVSLFLVLTLLPVLPKTMAVSQGKMISQTREQLDAERYIVTTLYDTTMARSNKTGAKSTDYYYKGSCVWTLTVYGAFYYDGKTSACTGDSVTYSTSSGWSCNSASSSHSGSSATAHGGHLRVQKRCLTVFPFPAIPKVTFPDGVFITA